MGGGWRGGSGELLGGRRGGLQKVGLRIVLHELLVQLLARRLTTTRLLWGIGARCGQLRFRPQRGSTGFGSAGEGW